MTSRHLRRILIVAIAFAIGVGIAVVLVIAFSQPDAPSGTHMPATPAPEVKRETTVPVQVAEPVWVFKPEVKKKLKLAPKVQADPKQHVVASTRTANDERRHTVTTTLDTSTGKFTTVDRAEPHPWLEVSTKRHFGAYIGAINGSEQAIALTARQEVLRVRGVRVEGVALGVLGQEERIGFIGIGASW